MPKKKKPPKAKISISIDRDLLAIVEAFASEGERSTSQEISRVLKEYYSKGKGSGNK